MPMPTDLRGNVVDGFLFFIFFLFGFRYTVAMYV